MKKAIALLMSVILAAGMFAGCSGKGTADGKEKKLEGTLSEIIDKIYAEKETGLSLQTTEIDITNPDSLKYYTGLSNADKITEAAASEAMMSAQAYSLVLVRVKDSKDAEAVADEMEKGIDQRKWICVGADDLEVETYGDIVLLVMVDTGLKDTVTADQITDAFDAVCGEKPED